jgi:hypothetical protein
MFNSAYYKKSLLIKLNTTCIHLYSLLNTQSEEKLVPVEVEEYSQSIKFFIFIANGRYMSLYGSFLFLFVILKFIHQCCVILYQIIDTH